MQYFVPGHLKFTHFFKSALILPKGQFPVSMKVKLGMTLKVALMISAVERFTVGVRRSHLKGLWHGIEF